MRNLEKLRNKIAPWQPAIFCGVLAVLTTIGNLWGFAVSGSESVATGIFILFMPTCFYFVGVYLTALRKENAELRKRLDAIDRPENENAEQSGGGQAATRAELK
jgi:hypothetical protein